MSDKISETAVKPLAVESADTVFDEPWQAQVLAMADLLIQSGQLSAAQWSSALGEALTKTQRIEDGFEDSKDSYYRAALAALTHLMNSRQIISQAQLQIREQQWKDAYLSTPHGKPVELKHS